MSALKARAPGLLVDTSSDHITRLAGTIMATGKTSEEAAIAFLNQHAAALGADRNDLVPLAADGSRAALPQAIPVMLDPATKTYRFSLYRYRQERDGIPVYRSRLQLLVRNDAQHAVVKVDSGARLLGAYQPTVAGRPVDAVALKAQLATLASGALAGGLRAAFGGGAATTSPEPVIYVDPSTGVPRAAGTYTAEAPDKSGKTMQWEVVADAETGAVLFSEERIVFDGDVTGTVLGNRSMDNRAPHCSTASMQPMMYAQVAGPSGTSAYGNANGAYTLPTTGTSPVTVSSRPSGRYFVVNDYVSSRTEVLSSTVTAPATVDFSHNQPDSELIRGQVNAYVFPNVVRDWALGFHPNYPTISTQTNMAVSTNRMDYYCPGNAWYDPSAQTINFCASGGEYGNTAFSSIVYHEYAHHMVEVGTSGQGEYGEGISDTVANLIDDQPGTGYGFFRAQCDQPLRNADNDCQYSATYCSTCGSEIHACGNLISGAFWSTRNAMRAAYPETYRQILGNLVVNSILVHAGSSITPAVAIDLLTLDDNDGDIGNGTPHRAQICAGFNAHGLTCPELSVGLRVVPNTGFSAIGPVGGPFNPSTVTYSVRNYYSSMPIHFTATTSAAWLTVAPTGGDLAPAGETPVTVTLNAAAAQLPMGTHRGTVQFVNTTDHVGDTSIEVTLRVTAPVQYSWPLDTDPGWTRQGTWQFGPAIAGGGDPASASTGTNVFGNVIGGTYFNFMGAEYLTTGAIDCSNITGVTLRFQRWLGIENNIWDHASVQVSRDGTTWTTVWANPDTTLIDTEWSTQEYDLSAVADHQRTVYVRWGLGPTDASVVYGGWSLDDIDILGFRDTVCTSDAQCDDRLYCNGQEHCTNGTCSAGTAPNCDDGVSCTVDACVESTDSCSHTADNSRCADASYCNGVEVCNAALGCQAGQPINCDDGVSCTVDSCSESTRACGHAADNARCNDGLFCTGVETCNTTLGCQAGAPPCPANQCNEQNDTCAPTNTCTDGQRNGSETDVDCGGSQCPKCDDGKQCLADSDCTSDNCVDGVCRPAASNLTAELTIFTDWYAGYCANLRITNNGSVPAASWRVGLEVPYATITGSWNGNYSSTRGAMTVTPIGWNAVIPPGQSRTDIGFCANRDPQHLDLPRVTSVTGTF